MRVDLTEPATDFGRISCSPAVVDAFDIGRRVAGLVTRGLIEETSLEIMMELGIGVVTELGVSLESGRGPAVNRRGEPVTVERVESVLRATDLTDAAEDLTVSGCLCG